jgi:hypothetical protein
VQNPSSLFFKLDSPCIRNSVNQVREHVQNPRAPPWCRRQILSVYAVDQSGRFAARQSAVNASLDTAPMIVPDGGRHANMIVREANQPPILPSRCCSWEVMPINRPAGTCRDRKERISGAMKPPFSAEDDDEGIDEAGREHVEIALPVSVMGGFKPRSLHRVDGDRPIEKEGLFGGGFDPAKVRRRTRDPISG